MTPEEKELYRIQALIALGRRQMCDRRIGFQDFRSAPFERRTQVRRLIERNTKNYREFWQPDPLPKLYMVGQDGLYRTFVTVVLIVFIAIFLLLTFLSR